MKKQLAIEIIASLLVLLFLYASMTKMLNIKEFKNDMYRQPLPLWMSTYLVWILPALQLMIAANLLFKRTRRLGFYASLVLMLLFTGYIAAGLLHFFKWIPCSCAGVLKGMSWTAHLYFNIFFILLSLVGVFLTSKNLPPGRRGDPRAVAAGL